MKTSQHMIQLRVTEGERLELEMEAKKRGISVSELIRRLLFEVGHIPKRIG